ncbi:biliverdin-producing heme oxygenase [Roseospira marina]|uniref:Biliverdin-producing heme oxygenase n=1 Tax=Roseospira marina TaxID=140057 RepID=A0A5M6IAI9_9PROT|nr:biliverdin-producing heme oxygenase [Roseospira marina]KAA5605281.1 biliverdin-producing heme oxygenase [Roseospira marina]MBB4314742.1 heme oxygenase [Roseospira marina]MBB5087731.1 heme oxygenase [Roseospira marina]
MTDSLALAPAPTDPPTPADPQTEPLMARLRTATREVHDALHETSALGLLLAPSLSAAAYGAILERFDALLEAADTQVLIPAAPWFAAQGFDWTSRRDALARDLADLADHSAAAAPGRPRPSPPTLDLPATPGAALGVLYVLEGSRLGGRGLARHLQGALPRPITGATRFLGSPGVDLGAHWRRVGGLIDRAGADPATADAAVAAAVHTFSVFTLWFERPR